MRTTAVGTAMASTLTTEPLLLHEMLAILKREQKITKKLILTLTLLLNKAKAGDSYIVHLTVKPTLYNHRKWQLNGKSDWCCIVNVVVQ